MSLSRILIWLLLSVRGYIEVGSRLEEGWSKPLPLYLFRCPEHGLVLASPSGYGSELRCPKCVEALRILARIDERPSQ